MKSSVPAIRSLFLVALGAATLAAPAVVRADTHVGVGIGIPLPNGYAEVHVGSERYYYHRGVYYRPGPHGYYVVPAPHGAYVRALPPYYTRVYVGGAYYYCYGNVYYQTYRDGYIVVNPPATVVAATPAPAKVEPQAQSVWVGDVEYTVKDGQFFRKNADGLVWTPAPLGAITTSLPAEAKSVWYQENEYFESDNVYFKKTPDGYRVIEAPWKGATPPPGQR